MKTIKDLYPEFLEYLQIKNKVTTIDLINSRFKNYILPYFENKKLDEINENEYIKFQIYLLKLNRSPSFYVQTQAMMNNFFDFLKFKYNIENIPKKVGFIKNQYDYTSNQHKQIWTKKEFKKFIKKVDNPTYHALFNLLFYTGVRKGEALALKVSDFNNNYISINRTITKNRYNGNRQMLLPKSKKSIRKIRIDFFLKMELKHLIKHYKQVYNNFSNDFFLFGGDKPISTTTLERKKNRYCKLAKVKQIRIHDFRHSHATMLFRKKVDIKTIKERLGHADISTTLDTYVHTDEKEEKKLIKMINFTRI